MIFQNNNMQPVTRVSKKPKIKAFYLFLVLLIVGFAIFVNKFINYSLKPDLTLMQPKLILPIKNEAFNKLPEIDKTALVKAVLNPEKELPTSDVLLELTTEQERPGRYLIESKLREAHLIISGKRKDDFSFGELIGTFDLAYKGEPSSKYVEFLLGLIKEYDKLEISDLIKVLELIRNQKSTLISVDSDLVLKFYANAIKIIKAQSIIVEDPLLASDLFFSLQLMPKTLDLSEVILKIRPILEAAYLNKNKSRKTDLFLTANESTQFSLQLIKIAWQYYLENQSAPIWMRTLSEKEACRLAFRLEPDGCLPDWGNEINRINLTFEIYKAALAFDRDDLRYIAFGGRRMPNAYPPKQKDYDFSGIGIYIIRSHWDNDASTAKDFFPEQVNHTNAFQITYDIQNKMISLSFGALTRFTFHCNSSVSNYSVFKNSFAFKLDTTPMSFENTLVISNLDLEVIATSYYYKILTDFKIISDEADWSTSNFTKLKDNYDVRMIRNEINKISRIQFLKRKMK